MQIVDDFKNTVGRWVMGYGTSGKDKVITKSYSKWSGMMARSTAGSAYQKRQPTYIGCTASDEFKDFQLFTDWYVRQVGYCQQDYHLDKDVLLEGNKRYEGNVCVLIPRDLNQFLNKSKATRGAYPQGVSFHITNQRFAANLSVNGKPKHVGYYATQDAASEAYKYAKETEARRWYERLKAGEFVIDERVTERMRTWEHICDWSPT